MLLDDIKRVIISQREEISDIFRNERVVEREYKQSSIEKYLAHPNILVVLGVRRCGKSIFSLQLFKNKKFGYINFDDERLAGIEARELELVLQAFYELYGTGLDCIVLDEPQNVVGWELFANRLRRTKKVIITGSNSKLLSGELATHLTGRYTDVTLFPFSFREFLEYNNATIGKNEIYSTKAVSSTRNFLGDYMSGSGFPETYKFGTRVLLRLYEDIINKDIFGRHAIRHKKTFKEVARYLLSNSACEFTYSKIKNIFGIKDVHTVKNWVDCLASSYLIFTLERFSYKLKEQAIAPRKVYASDIGLVTTIGFAPTERKGALAENAVFLDLLRRRARDEDGSEIYYWKDSQQREVDFVLKNGKSVKQLIQVCLNLQEANTKERESNALLKASKELKCKNLLVITWEHEAIEKIGGKRVMFTPLWKWLLELDKPGKD